MFYSSTRGKDKNLGFTEVLLNGLAHDGGLYIPQEIPFFNEKDLNHLRSLDYANLAYEIIKPFIANAIPNKNLKEICVKTYKKSFGKRIISFNHLNENECIANLFHGPTFAFKDFALQLLGNIYDFILEKKNIKLTILGATSGDTGSAAIEGCSKSDNVRIFILFPHGRVSEVQRRQMTTVNKKNVFNIAVKGNFDDCQRLVKSFFKLNNEKRELNLAAVNSINWVRIMGQIVYYFWIYFRVNNTLAPINFVVPTGNFGNAYAGYISKKMGLPIQKIVISSNKNDILARFFHSGKMVIKNTLTSLSPSMDIQISSNFERLLHDYIGDGMRVGELFAKLDASKEFGINQEHLKKMLNTFGYGKLTDYSTKKTIKFIYNKYKVIIDPHTAVGISVGQKQLKTKEKRVYLSTAHYCKFINTVRESIDKKIEYSKDIKKLLNKKESFYVIENSIDQLKEFITKKLR